MLRNQNFTTRITSIRVGFSYYCIWWVLKSMTAADLYNAELFSTSLNTSISFFMTSNIQGWAILTCLHVEVNQADNSHVCYICCHYIKLILKRSYNFQTKSREFQRWKKEYWLRHNFFSMLVLLGSTWFVSTS